MTETARHSDDVRLQILVRRLDAVSAGGPLAILSSVASALVLLGVYHDTLRSPWPALWIGAIALGMAVRIILIRRTDISSTDPAYLETSLRWAAAILAFLSTVWGLGIPMFAILGHASALPVLAGIAAAMHVGVLLLYRSIPRSAYYNIIVLGAGMAVASYATYGLDSWPLQFMVLVYSATLWIAVGRLDRLFVDGIVNEIGNAEAAATVSMLLHDFEEQSSDWLWTVGPDSNLRDVAPRFAAAAGSDVDRLEGTALIKLFEPGEERDRLARHLIERSPFRDLLVRLRVEGDIHYWRLSARPREDGRMTGVARDVTHDRLIEERVAFMAHYDSLTGLANRYLFNERLRRLLGAQGERSSTVALFYLDLDDFKSVNDTRGHLVGDKLLREVAQRLLAEVREEDLVARLGGDEFAVLIETRVGMGMLIERAHRFLAAIREPFAIDGNFYRVSTSIGVARCADGDCDAEELMRRADLALFAAKRKGRDTLAMFEPALDREARERRELEGDLRDAIPRGQLRLHYQPVIDLNDGAITGYEALLRWHHPRRGLIGPLDFLPIAEETGLILPIGEWVIRQALAEISRWAGDFRIAINLSPTQVRSPHLVALVAQALHANDIAPERVEFEITEHVLLLESETGSDTLMRLRELGTRIALDDFGTGYSSLGYLRQMPFDRLKIDRQFIVGIEDDISAQAIVSSITRLADAMGMQTTAEGIENRRQLDLLRKLGCHEAQGFLICEPSPGDAFATPEAVEAAMSGKGTHVLDYRKAREAALRRHG
jgi:diguanylate cyclase (GGDEF)-like protein